jgi:hypothetical protein
VAVDQVDAAGGAPVLVCFGGIAGGLLGPPFEFLRHTDGLTAHRVFLRDLDQCWYQMGLQSLGSDVPSSAVALSAVLDDLAPSRRVFLGTSSGALASVLFGVLTGADKIISLSPQTSLRMATRIRYQDRRWGPQIRKARAHSVDPLHLDLLALLRAYPDHGPVDIHFGRDDRLDTRHALRLDGERGVTLASHPGGHTFVRQLRDNGELRPILEDALAG